MAVDLLQHTSLEDVVQEVSRLRTVVRDAVEDGVKSAVKAAKHSREAEEDFLHDAKHHVKRRPLETVGVVFAVGMLTGAFLTWIVSRRD